MFHSFMCDESRRTRTDVIRQNTQDNAGHSTGLLSRNELSKLAASRQIPMMSNTKTAIYRELGHIAEVFPLGDLSLLAGS